MIRSDCKIYVIGKGFLNLTDLNIGDPVYSLDGLQSKITTIKSLRSEYVYGKINVIDSGAHGISISADTRLLYYNEVFGSKYLEFKEIYSHTPDKGYDPKKYLPVLSWVHRPGERNFSDSELEYLARTFAADNPDYKSFQEITNNCLGEDAQCLLDMMEFWCSISPGIGLFDTVSRKSRSHIFRSKIYAEKLSVIAALAGYTSVVTTDQKNWFLKVNYESMPIPGSRPKSQKYFQRNYFGLMYNVVTEENNPVFGISETGRRFYLPTTTAAKVVI